MEQVIKDQLTEVNKKLDIIVTNQQKMEHYLYDDISTDSHGLVSQVRELAKRVLRLEQRNMIEKAKASVWGVVGGAAVGLVYFLIKGAMYVFR